MKTFQNWFKENYPNEDFPMGSVNGQWFGDHGLPMIVACTCCEMIMALPSALIGEECQIFCSSCAKVDEEEEEVVDEYTLDDLGKNWY